MKNKTNIRKNAEAATVETEKASGVFELTDLEVKEVSLVDKGANRRVFLVTKKAGARGEVITGAPKINPLLKNDETIAALDAADAAKPDTTPPAVDAEKATWSTAFVDGLPDSSFLFVEAGGEKKDGKTEPKSLRHFPYKDADGKIDLPHLRNAIARIPQSDAKGLDKEKLQARAEKLLEDKKPDAKKADEPVVDEAAELAKLRAAVDQGVTKTDVSIAPAVDGSVTMTIEAAPAPAPVAPASVIEAVKTAMLGGIDAISERLMKFRADVASGALLQNWSQSGQHDIWGQTYYLQAMIDQLCYIGGPAWEIEQAGDAAMDVDKASGEKRVAKAHKAITAARLEKMRGIHKAMIYAHNDMDKLIKELDSEAGSATDGKETPDTGTQYQPDRGSSFAKAETAGAPAAVAAPVVAPAAVAVAVAVAAPAAVAAVVKAADPELIEMKRSLAEQSQMVESLRQIVAEQSATINKSRTAQDSNSNPVEDDVQKSRHGEADRDNVKWPLDLADRKVPDRGKKF